MRKIYIISVVAATLLCMPSCGNGDNSRLTDVQGDAQAYNNAPVNAIDQALPQVMILPSDASLKAYSALSYNGGQVSRDYNKYLLEDKNARPLYSVIQNEFVAQGFPLNDLEQTLKQLSTRGATDRADDLARDAKTELLMTASPDIILEVDYSRHIDSRTYKTSGKYTLSFIDAYTGKVFSTKNITTAEGDDISALFSSALKSEMPSITKEIKGYFADILTRGREISVRVTVANGSPINLSDENIEGDTYSDWIRDYMKAHTVKGAYKMTVNTRYEMAFANVRIQTLSQDGTQYNAYDWARDFAKAIRNQLGVKVENRSQGLGDVHLVIM